ncbi:GTPase HflX [Frankliniella fusca]|uniref:GTPase HflX n=1 Tax=Frankliniella fusca TaxID=407009 RepID=A0AAE1HJN4_9NEOP|nr:GTPase HflX [Frankliniella fusca]
MAAPGKPKSLLDGIALKPLTQENLLYHYAPLAGAASYTTLSGRVLRSSSETFFHHPPHPLLTGYRRRFGELRDTPPVSLSNPNMLRRLFPTKDITNTLLLTSIAGTALYIYKRPHLEKVPNQLRITYSVYGAGMLCLSSILVWSILRYYLPDNAVIQTATGVATSVGLLILGKDYLDLLEKK